MNPAQIYVSSTRIRHETFDDMMEDMPVDESGTPEDLRGAAGDPSESATDRPERRRNNGLKIYFFLLTKRR